MTTATATKQKESFTIYQVLNYGWYSAFEDDEIEVTGLDKSFNFSNVTGDQPSMNNLCNSVRLFQKIESYLTDADIQQVIKITFGHYYYSFDMVKMFFNKYRHLIDVKMVLNLLNGYKCYQTEYKESSYKKPLYCHDWQHPYSYDYDKMLYWLYENYKTFTDEALAYRKQHLSQYYVQ